MIEDPKVLSPIEDLIGNATEVLDYRNHPLSTSQLPIILTCEHASKNMKEASESLTEVEREILDMHWGSDIGAKECTEVFARELECEAVLATFSRLIIDLNRPISNMDGLILKSIADPQCEFQFNKDLSAQDVYLRISKYYVPFKLQVANILNEIDPSIHIAVHSFSPSYPGSGPRECELGIMFPQTSPLIDYLVQVFTERKRDFKINYPYDAQMLPGWGGICDFIRFSNYKRKIMSGMLEIRNDKSVDVEYRKHLAEDIKEAVMRLTLKLNDKESQEAKWTITSYYLES